MSVFRVILVHTFPACSRIRSEYREIQSISPYSLRMLENAGKMRTRITLNTDSRHAVVLNIYSSAIFTTISIITKHYNCIIKHCNKNYTTQALGVCQLALLAIRLFSLLNIFNRTSSNIVTVKSTWPYPQHICRITKIIIRFSWTHAFIDHALTKKLFSYCEAIS